MVYGVENERNEEYSYTFIAMHKKFRLRDIVHDALSTEKKRQQLLDRAHRPSRQLNDLGQIGVPLDQVAVHLDQGVSRPNVTRPRVGRNSHSCGFHTLTPLYFIALGSLIFRDGSTIWCHGRAL